MQFALAVTTVLLAVLTPVPAADANADPSVTQCKNPTPVKKFAASFYTAIVVSTDPNIVDTLQVSSREAGMIFYNETKNSLEARRACNADEAAFIVGRSTAGGGPVKLPALVKMVANSIAMFLNDFGLLDCDNAIRLSLQCYGFVGHRKEGLDDHKFATYVHAITYGVQDFYMSLGLNVVDTVVKAASGFLVESQSDKPKNPECQV